MKPQTFPELIDVAIRTFGDRVFCIERKQFRRIEWTYAELGSTSQEIAQFMVGQGVKSGDTIGICAPNGPWWLAAFIAAARLKCPVVPIDANSSEEFIGKVAKKTKLALLFKTVYKPLADKPDCPVIELEQLRKLLDQSEGSNLPKATLHPDDILEIVFTSGSTGDPKGVVLTHRNVVSNVHALLKAWPVDKSHVLLSMIPLSHMFEQTVGFLAPFTAGSRVVYVQSVRPYQIVQALLAENITTIVTVPAFLSLLRRRLTEKAEAKHFITFLNFELKLAKPLPFAIRRYIFQGLYWQLGRSLKLVAVGGAALPPDLEDFWEQLGIHIAQGYGLTETSPIATYSGLKHKKRGSVGRCLPGQHLKLADDGEILLRGSNVFGGYFENQVESAKVLQDGWFHTGDIGRLDKQGFMFITGRKKNMLLSESGLNIYPEDIETVLASFPVVKDSVVILLPINGHDTLTAVILTDKTEDDLTAIIKQANQRLASHQAIQHTIIWPEQDFPRTPTRKIKRQPVIDAVKDQAHKPGGSGHVGPSDSYSALQLILAQVAGVAPQKIHDSSQLVNDLGMDSLRSLELISKIEEELGAFIKESDINTKTTVKSLEHLVKNAAHSPKPKLFNLSPFETPSFSAVRVVLQLPLLAFASIFQKLKVDQDDHPNGPVLYVANHTSHFDTLGMLRMLSLRHRSTLLVAAAQDYFFDNRLKSWLLRLFVPLIPLDREGNIQESLQRMGSFIDQGYSILVFPEGTRSQTGTLLPFKAGIGVMAQELEVPVVPIRFRGNEEILPKGKKWPQRGSTTAHIGKSLLFGKDRQYQTTTDAIQDCVAAL